MSEFDLVSVFTDIGITALGTLFGIGGGLWYDRRRKRIERDETREETVSLIKPELEQFKSFGAEYLKNPIRWNATKRNFDGIYPTITFDTFQSTLFSGNLSLLKPELQTKIGLINVKIESIKQYANQIINFHTSSIYTDENLSKQEAERISASTNRLITELLIETDKALVMMNPNH